MKKIVALLLIAAALVACKPDNKRDPINPRDNTDNTTQQ